MHDIQAAIIQAITDLFAVSLTPELTRPEEQFGEYATNVALQLAGQVKQPPRQVAEALAEKVRMTLGDTVKDITIAGPGFINFTLSDQALSHAAERAPHTKPHTHQDQVVVAEYSDPNPFKVLHAGHLYTTLMGDAISRLFEVAGAHMHRVNFGGDVGLHVAKNMWGIIRHLGGEDPEKMQKEVGSDPHAQAAWLSARYVEGNTAYEENETAKEEIIAINKRVYALHEQDDHTTPFAQIYWLGRQWSYDYFQVLYDELGVLPFEKFYPESSVAPTGIATVRSHMQKGMYEESDGAVVFRGEPYGLHTRVFINQHGLPTYEAKDVGLIMQKWQDYHFDLSLIITGNDQVEYMKVVQKSIEQFEPELTQRSRHLTHGNVKLAGGKKMSSRKGNVILALDVLEAAREANQQVTGRQDESAVLGAVKYAFLKQRMGGDIVYDPKESVSLEGNSGPYLQYAHARACSILKKGTQTPAMPDAYDAYERSLARKIGEYTEVLDKAVAELLPHHICTYLYELAQTFNRFYEHATVVGDPREQARLQLVTWYADVLRDGLQLLGINAPDAM